MVSLEILNLNFKERGNILMRKWSGFSHPPSWKTSSSFNTYSMIYLHINPFSSNTMIYTIHQRFILAPMNFLLNCNQIGNKKDICGFNIISKETFHCTYHQFSQRLLVSLGPLVVGHLASLLTILTSRNPSASMEIKVGVHLHL